MSAPETNPCLACGTAQHCCSRLSGLILSEEEFARHFAPHLRQLELQRSRGRVTIVGEKSGGPCPHWGTGGCRIYRERPIDCRLFPYIPTHFIERGNRVKIVFHGRSDCPQKERLLRMMPVTEVEALLVELGRKIYGEGRSVVVRQEKGGAGRLFNRIEAALFRRLNRTKRAPMPIAADIRNACSLLYRGHWREFLFRVRVHLQKIDLKNSYLEELNLPEERCHYYANSGGAHLEQVLDALEITDRDSVVDFGSGKGGALITLSRYPFARLLGVEISPELTQTARGNFRKLGIGRIKTVVADAAEFTDLDDYNYFYFFNPFPGKVMSAVAGNLSDSLARVPRKAVLIYFNPEYHETLVGQTPFVKTGEFHHHELSFFVYCNHG